MAIFQKSVLNRYLLSLDENIIKNAFKEFNEYFGDKERIENIKALKEENYQEGFLREVFVDVLGYTINPDKNYNLTTEYKNEADSKKADGAIIKDGDAIAIIELKSTKTTDMKSIEEQAFNYKRNHKNCRYVITSNFDKLYFYIDDYSVDYEEFNLFNMDLANFKRFYLTLSKDSIFDNLPVKIKDDSKVREVEITKALYSDYHAFKRKIFNNMTENNPAVEKLVLLKKSQKLLDRLLFIFFAEDRMILPDNMISKISDEFREMKEKDEYKPLYYFFKKYFKYIDEGIQRKDFTIYGFNGELFKPDEVLESLIIDDEILYDDAVKISSYDFQTDIDVDILGHIFENSLNDIEELHAEINGIEFDRTKTKRKKEGVFYTPKYITKYIVDNTLGVLCEEKKKELKLVDIELDTAKDYKRLTKDKKDLLERILQYREYLLSLKILDPACGSGAFLIQALDYLINEHQFIEEYRKSLEGDLLGLYEIEKSILEHNIYGVDINEEAVEIAKLSLWLRTAEKGRKLNDLSSHIKCGNSLIDDKEIAGDKAFKWEEEFPEIMKKKNKEVEAFHITWVTHNSRVSERMIEYNVKKGEPFIFSADEEIKISEIIKDIVIEKNYKLLAYNICKDHVHVLIVCNPDELPDIIKALKGKSSQKYKEFLNIPNDEEFHLWAQKYDNREIKDDNKLDNTVNYINNNREKHNLPENKGLQPLVALMIADYNDAFTQFESGGFDVVIGNPPYIPTEFMKDIEKDYYKNKYNCLERKYDSSVIFILKGLELLNKIGKLSFISSITWQTGENYFKLRKRILLENDITKIINLPFDTFQDAYVDTGIYIFEKNNNHSNYLIYQFPKEQKIYSLSSINFNNIGKNNIKEPDYKIILFGNMSSILSKIQNNCLMLGSITDSTQGLAGNMYNVIDFKTDNKNIFPYLIKGQAYRYEFILEDVKYTDMSSYKTLIKYYTKNERILIRRIINRQNRLMATFCNEDLIVKKDLNPFLVIDNNFNLKYILALINSSLFSFLYLNQSTIATKDDFRQTTLSELRKLPIFKIDKENQKPFIQKADLMLSLNKSLHDKKEKFISRIKTNFNLEKITGKLEDFYLYDFKDFIDELAKQKIKLSLKDQDEWEDYFKEYKTELSNIKNEIDKTDREIDGMVYQLYGLTEEEIRIVEGEI